MNSKLLIATWFLAVASVAATEDLRIELEPQSSSITFRLKATMHTVHGSAKATSGSLALDTESGVMSGEVVIDAVSAETGNTKRDKKMHTKVLRSADYGRIVLGVDRLEGDLAKDGASDVVVFGAMVLLGQPHQIRIQLHVEIVNGLFTASGEFEIPYVDWGLEDPSTFVLRVAKEVQVTVEAHGTVAAADKGGAGPAATHD